MKNITVLGIDLAKVFQLHGVNEYGKVNQLKRDQQIEQQLAIIMDKLNNRPRKSSGYLSPANHWIE